MTENIFENILKLNSNNKCVDCGNDDISYVSINNGVFICSKCFFFHREFQNKEISNIQPFNQEFLKNDIEYFSIGGNDRFINNLIEFFYTD